jgi:uncharacterized membrane protein YcaP (DUF421 family)
MTAFELLLLVVVGDLIQGAVTADDMSLVGSMLAVGTFAVLILLFSWSGFRWKRVRDVVEGVPVVVLRNGRPLKEALHLERVTLDELLESARQQGIANLADVELAVLEPDGRFSFITWNHAHHRSPERHQA